MQGWVESLQTDRRGAAARRVGDGRVRGRTKGVLARSRGRVRLVQTGRDDASPWGVAELELRAP